MPSTLLSLPPAYPTLLCPAFVSRNLTEREILRLSRSYQEAIKRLTRNYQEPIAGLPRVLSRGYNKTIKRLSGDHQEPIKRLISDDQATIYRLLGDYEKPIKRLSKRLLWTNHTHAPISLAPNPPCIDDVNIHTPALTSNTHPHESESTSKNVESRMRHPYKSRNNQLNRYHVS